MSIINPGPTSSAFPEITSQQVKLSFCTGGCHMFSVDGMHRAENSICFRNAQLSCVSAELSASNFKGMPRMLERGVCS